jgi:GGDEF domain-containing protein/CHASE3 domain sensor protein
MPVRLFSRLNLIQKMIISFVVSGLFMLSALIYSVASMGAMHRIEEEIARTDLTAVTVTISLHEIIQAQERIVGKYQILHQPEFREIYERNAAKFVEKMAQLRQMSQGPAYSKLSSEYSAYARSAGKLFADQPVSPAAMRQSADRVGKAIEQLRTEQQDSLERKLKDSDKQESQTVVISIGLAIGGVVTAFVIAFLMVYSFAASIGKLQRATHRIADGDFDHDPGIPPGDEIGSLAQDFSRMAERLKELEQISLDASPLTRLPGNIAIEDSLSRRMREQSRFVMCYMDLDNFKSYNDRYGYIKASELLKDTGRLIHIAVKRLDDPEAFVGHIGGDDFVAIVSADRAEAACREIIADFDAMIPGHYSDEDRNAGAINGIDRYGVPRIFPLVSISIAALVCHPGDYASAAEIATAAAKVKDHVKCSSGSNYIIVREAELHEV